jgi:uncharacterized protein DUF5047
MRTVSDTFLATLRGSHLVDAHLELHFPDDLGTAVVVPLETGQVTIDRTAQIRRTASVVIPWSYESRDVLGVDIRTLPLGGYVVPKRGILFADGSSELVTLGYLRCESATWSTVEQRATLELADRMAQVRDEPFQAPYAANGKRVATAARELVDAVFGAAIGYDVRFDPNVILADVYFSDSRLDALFELASSVGAETYFDADGNWVFDVAAGQQAIKRSGTLTDDSPVVTGLAQTSDLSVGMTVTGTGIPAARRIASINSASQVTLNANANTLGQKNSRTEAGSKLLTDITDTDDLSLGMTVAGAGIPAGSTIVALAPAQVTLDQAATASGYPPCTFTAPSPAALTFAGAASAYPVWQIDAGDAGVLVDANESLDRTGVYNGVLVTGQPTAVTAAFAVLVTDADPLSPTRWGGPFGHVLRIEASTSIQNATQAQTAGQVMLNDGLGLTRSLVLTSAPNPALEAGDTVLVLFADGRSETHLLDVVRLDLGTGSIELSTRTTAKPSAGAAEWAPFPAGERRVFTGEDVWRELRGAVVAERIRERAPRR